MLTQTKTKKKQTSLYSAALSKALGAGLSAALGRDDSDDPPDAWKPSAQKDSYLRAQETRQSPQKTESSFKTPDFSTDSYYRAQTDRAKARRIKERVFETPAFSTDSYYRAQADRQKTFYPVDSYLRSQAKKADPPFQAAQRLKEQSYLAAQNDRAWNRFLSEQPPVRSSYLQSQLDRKTATEQAKRNSRSSYLRSQTETPMDNPVSAVREFLQWQEQERELMKNPLYQQAMAQAQRALEWQNWEATLANSRAGRPVEGVSQNLVGGTGAFGGGMINGMSLGIADLAAELERSLRLRAIQRDVDAYYEAAKTNPDLSQPENVNRMLEAANLYARMVNEQQTGFLGLDNQLGQLREEHPIADFAGNAVGSAIASSISLGPVTKQVADVGLADIPSPFLRNAAAGTIVDSAVSQPFVAATGLLQGDNPLELQQRLQADLLQNATGNIIGEAVSAIPDNLYGRYLDKRLEKELVNSISPEAMDAYSNAQYIKMHPDLEDKAKLTLESIPSENWGQNIFVPLEEEPPVSVSLKLSRPGDMDETVEALGLQLKKSDMFDAVKSHLSALDEFGLPKPEEAVPIRLCHTNPKYEKNLLNTLYEFAQSSVDAECKYEVNYTVTSDGSIWLTAGDKASVFPNRIPELGGPSLKGSYSWHTHPEANTPRSFSAEDVMFFFEHEEQVSIASDKQFVYYMMRKTDTPQVSREIIQEKYDKILNIAKYRNQNKSDFIADRDAADRTMKILSKIYNFTYKRIPVENAKSQLLADLQS